jgi:hypothetical protein
MNEPLFRQLPGVFIVIIPDEEIVRVIVVKVKLVDYLGKPEKLFVRAVRFVFRNFCEVTDEVFEGRLNQTKEQV